MVCGRDFVIFFLTLVNICSFVNLADVIACKPEFVRALEARKSNSDVGDKYAIRD